MTSEKLKTLMRLGKVSTLALSVGALAAPSIIAQDAEDIKDVEVDEAAVAPEKETPEEIYEDLDEIIITGSKLRRSKVSNSSPVDVIQADTAKLEGIVDVGSLLRTSTIASGSQQLTAATGTEYVQNGGIGAQTISLRGLGASRTLVLLNGRRAGPAGVRGAVSSFDMNVLPISAVERIEVLKDGASSIYGSDAVAGVINIITKKEDGGSIEGYYSQPQRSGGEEFRINATYGKVFDRGNFRLTGDYYRQSELARGDRDYFQCGEAYTFKPNTGERGDPIDPRTGTYACQDLLWGQVWTYDYAATSNLQPARNTLIQYDRNGDLGNYIPGIPDGDFSAPDGWYQVLYDRDSDAVADYDHPFQDKESLIPKTEIFTGMAEAEYEITDSITAYAEAMFNRRKTSINGYRQYWTYIYNSNFNFVDGLGAAGSSNPMADGWTGTNWLSPTPITDHSDASATVDYMRFVAGFKGNFGDFLPDWNWDVSMQYSKSDAEYWNERILNDSIEMTWFRTSLCGADEVTAISGKQCVDVDWLNPDLLAGEVTDAEREFLFDSEVGTTIYKQMTIDAVIDGSLFDLPAGAVATAFGFQYQDESLDDTPGDITLANNAWGSSSAGRTYGSQETWAMFGEIEMPLLADRFLIKELVFNASARYTSVKPYRDGDSYDSNSATTYKIGVSWQITDEFRVRATRGSSFRSPALYESFLAAQTSSLRQSAADPCQNWALALNNGSINQRTADNCAAEGIPDDFIASISATVETSGGADNLEPETSLSKTVGIVWTPTWADITLSIDYFDYLIKGEVSQIGGANIATLCYDSEDFDNEPLCDLITRADGTDGLPRYTVETIRDNYINIATQRSKGIDVNLTYRTDSKFGFFTFNTEHTFQIEDYTELFPGSIIDTNGEAGEPIYTGRVEMNLQREKWGFAYSANLIGKTSNVDSYGGNTITYYGETLEVPLEIPFWHYHNASASYKINEDLTVLFGVRNVFDKKPPRLWTNNSEVANVGKAAFYSQYDWTARSFYLNISQNF